MLSSATMQIRTLTPEDSADFARVRLQGLQESPRAFGSSPEEDRCVDPDRVAEKIQHEPESPLFGVFDPGLVAVAGLHRNTHRKSRHRAAIWGVYVLPDHRGRGLASRLLEYVLAKAATMVGLERVDLCVVADNRQAIGLYEKLGFAVWGHEIGAMIVDGDYLDEYHLTLRIQPGS